MLQKAQVVSGFKFVRYFQGNKGFDKPDFRTLI
jgi:hypothetical protein